MNNRRLFIMETAARFFEHSQKKLAEVMDNAIPSILAAADLVTETCKKGGRFYVFGSGHSHMIAEELYLRAGGMALVHAILPPELMLHEMTLKSTALERLEGYAYALADLYKMDEKDTLMVISNSGRNPVPVEMCLAAKAKGTKVIAMTSMQHSSGCASRHSSGKKMYEIADVTIDTCVEKGDAVFRVEGVATGVGPTSSIVGVTIAEALICQVMENLAKAGMEPPVFCSSNVDGGDEKNQWLYDTYYGYWK